MIIKASPYDFPIKGELNPSETALFIIDMQRDFCDPHGYLSTRGEDISPARAIIPRIQAVCDAARAHGLTLVYTREGHRPNLSDLPENKRLLTAMAGAAFGSEGPLGRLMVRGEKGWDFTDEVQPRDEDIVIDKSGTGAFHGTELGTILRMKGIRNVILTGVTTGVCVNTTAREASDHGYNVLVLEDCCAESDPENHRMAIQILRIEGGFLATIAGAEDFLAALPANTGHKAVPKPSQ